MATKVLRPLKVIAFNGNGIVSQRYELSKQLQGLHIDVAPFSDTSETSSEVFIPNLHRTGGTVIAVRTGISHKHVDLPPLVSVEATWVCIPIGNSVVLLATVYKSPGRAWSDTDISELLSFRPKFILAGDLNDQNPFWNSAVSNPSGDKLLHLFDVNDFEISAPQYPTHESPSGNGDVLDIVLHQNIEVSDVIVADILDSDHLPIIFHILDHVKIRNLSDPIEKLTDWNVFNSLASELISPKIKIKCGVEAEKAALEISASIASAYRLPTNKIALLDLNNDLPGFYRLLKHKKRLRKVWQETRVQHVKRQSTGSRKLSGE
jgi:hypothetical protein